MNTPNTDQKPPLTPTESRAGKPVKGMRTVLIVSIIGAIVALIIVVAVFMG